ncbi:hypothetical protein E2C01_010404 [Portunus trituberculatus]|uniref:Uncharacterized protein n=1 Tax=Portunus trituberculatus TaxID=210409 RepID=A0A5B7D8D6_PORTR|nr:hypothetical protein [Portunus trituberculatus]
MSEPTSQHTTTICISPTHSDTRNKATLPASEQISYTTQQEQPFPITGSDITGRRCGRALSGFPSRAHLMLIGPALNSTTTTTTTTNTFGSQTDAPDVNIDARVVAPELRLALITEGGEKGGCVWTGGLQPTSSLLLPPPAKPVPFPCILYHACIVFLRSGEAVHYVCACLHAPWLSGWELEGRDGLDKTVR